MPVEWMIKCSCLVRNNWNTLQVAVHANNRMSSCTCVWGQGIEPLIAELQMLTCPHALTYNHLLRLLFRPGESEWMPCKSYCFAPYHPKSIPYIEGQATPLVPTGCFFEHQIDAEHPSLLLLVEDPPPHVGPLTLAVWLPCTGSICFCKPFVECFKYLYKHAVWEGSVAVCFVRDWPAWIKVWVSMQTANIQMMPENLC